MMVVMEQKDNLKEEIVSAVVEHLISFEERINARMDGKFAKGQDTINQRIDKLEVRVTILEER
jgi:hypothetical protein